MPNIIDLRLLDNKNIIAELNGIPLAQENSYRIIAGEKNATQFRIKSKPTQYANAQYTVEMVNSQGYGIKADDIGLVEKNPNEYIIENNIFVLPVGMAVAGYGWVQIRAYQTIEGLVEEEVVPFMTLKIKIWNTLPNWKEHIEGGSDIDLSKYYEKKENVEIADRRIIVGGTSSQKYNQAFITDEEVGIEDPYNVNYALLKLNETSVITGEQLGPTLRLGKSFLSAIDDYPYNYLKLPKKDGTLATLDDVGSGAIIHEDVNFPLAVTDETFYDIVGQPEQTHILNGCAVVNNFANTGFNVVYQLPGSGNLTIYSYGVAADNDGLHPATGYPILTSDGGIVWVLGETAVSGRFIATEYGSTNETRYEPSKIVDNINGTEINIPQNRNGTFALVEDVENKVDKDYSFVAEVVLEENGKEFVVNTDSAGNSLSDYNEFLVMFVGKFTQTSSSYTPIYLRFDGGSIYQSYDSFTISNTDRTYFKIWQTNKQYIGHIDKYFYRCNYTKGIQNHSNTDGYLWQGLDSQNADMKFDSCMSKLNWSEMRLTMNIDGIFAAGSKLLVLGKK